MWQILFLSYKQKTSSARTANDLHYIFFAQKAIQRLIIIGSEENVWVRSENLCENPGMTSFPINKRINTELFIDRKAALYIGETRIRVVTYEGDQPAGTSWLEERVYLAQKCYLGRKRCENERSDVNLSWNKFNTGIIKIWLCVRKSVENPAMTLPIKKNQYRTIYW